MCEATNLNEIKLEVIELKSEFLEKIEAWRRHFEWLKSLDKGIPKIKREYIRLCHCGSKLQKINGFLICKNCGFKNEIYLHCPKCRKNRSFKLNKDNNRCLTCGHTWNRKRSDSKRVYFYIRRFRMLLKEFYHRKEKKVLKKVDKLQSKFNKKILKKHQKLVFFREKRFREMMNLGEEI